MPKNDRMEHFLSLSLSCHQTEHFQEGAQSQKVHEYNSLGVCAKYIKAVPIHIPYHHMLGISVLQFTRITISRVEQ